MLSENPIQSQTILITGAAGFIGSHLCERLLASGNHVFAVDNLNNFYDPKFKMQNLQQIESAASPGQFYFIHGDIRNYDLMKETFERIRPTMVVHLAAMAGVRPSIENPMLYVDVNVQGTQVLLELCRSFHISSFIFASSSSVYGNNPKIPFTETDPVDHPISPYAATKKAGELLCNTYAHLYRMQIPCLRFFTVYGPRQRPDLAIRKFSDLLMAGNPVPVFGDGKSKRDYTYIDDIIDGVLKAMSWSLSAKPRSCEIFNLGNSHPVSLNELLETLEKALGIQAIRDQRPQQPGDVEITFADLSKSEKILGYSPLVQFREGIRKFVEWYLPRKETPIAPFYKPKVVRS